MSAPAVYKAITAIAGDLSGIGIAKRHRNERDDYRYRSIDDVLNRLSPLLAKHKLCVLPRVLERTASDRVGDGDLLLVRVTLKVAFDLVSSVDGSSHTVEAFGEALDGSDKATAKAMSSAYKHAMLQAFCVPVAQVDDADAGSYRLKRSRSHQQEPVEGWAMWATGITDIIESCATGEALERLQDRQRPLLKAIGREQPELYTQLGAAFAKRTAELNGERCAMSGTAPNGEQCTKSSAAADGEQCTAPPKANVRRGKTDPLRKRLGAKRANSAPATNGEARAKRSVNRVRPPQQETRQMLKLPNRLERERSREPNSRECAAHRAWVRKHHCCVPGCLARPIECAHVRRDTDGGTGLKPSDRWVISLCRDHHIEQHQIGEAAFESRYGIDMRALAMEFAKRSPQRTRLREIVAR